MQSVNFYFRTKLPHCWYVQQKSQQVALSIYSYVAIYHILQIVRGVKVLWHAKITGKHSWLYGSCMAKDYCTGYFTGKVLWLLINPRKPQNFSTSNNLQYTVASCVGGHV